jgi:hypothetical protein
MIRITCFLAIVMAGITHAHGSEITDAVIRLKKAHVERSFESCLAKGAPEDRCRKLLQIIHKREEKVLARLAPAMSDPSVNLDQFNTEMTACYSPNNEYTHLVDCWERLADRLEAARAGSFLLKR